MKYKNPTDKKRNYFGFFFRQYEIWKLFHIGVKHCIELIIIMSLMD